MDSVKDLNLIAGLEEVLLCVTSIKNLDEDKLLQYLNAYGSGFLYQKLGFIFEQYQLEMGVSDNFINVCKKRSGNAKRYLINGINKAAYSGEWKLVYPKDMKKLKNGGIEDATV